MDERPSFRRREDVRRLIIALLTPWVLGGLAYSFPLVGRELYRGGFQPDWLGPVILFWFYGFGFPAMLSAPAWFMFGVWRLVRRPAYRRSWYGRLWLLFMYANMCAVVPVIGH